jgi:hypothetical protein
VRFCERVAVGPGFKVFHCLPVGDDDLVVSFYWFENLCPDESWMVRDGPFPVLPSLFEGLLVALLDWNPVRDDDNHDEFVMS